MVKGSSPTNRSSGQVDVPWRIEVFYDGDCPLCRREVELIGRFDRRGLIRRTDIAEPDFDPADYDRTMAAFMDEIQGRLPNGTWVTGVEVFRQIYQALGWGPVVLATRLPIISQALEFGYRMFARNRLKLTGRCHSPSASCRQ